MLIFFFFLSIVEKDDKHYFCTTKLSLNHCWKEKDCLPTLVILLELQRHEVNVRSEQSLLANNPRGRNTLDNSNKEVLVGWKYTVHRLLPLLCEEVLQKQRASNHRSGPIRYPDARSQVTWRYHTKFGTKKKTLIWKTLTFISGYIFSGSLSIWSYASCLEQFAAPWGI